MITLWKRCITVGIALTLGALGASAQVLNTNGGPVSVELVAETGFVKVLSHTITIGSGGDAFDYVREGGQEILSPIDRYSAELTIGGQDTIIFLYQPLELTSQVRFLEARTIDGQLFPADEGVNVTYSFPFYRLSYLHDFASSPRLELAAGLSLQLRNASVRFVSTNGESIAVSQDLGPVPIIKVRGEYRFNGPIPGAFVGLEADAFYASSAFFNGADFNFTGSIYDASLRFGFSPRPGLDVFANVRGLGGGANGTRPAGTNLYWTQSESGYTDNFLNTLSVTLGARLH